MPGDAEEGIEVEMLPLVLSLAPCGGAGICGCGNGLARDAPEASKVNGGLRAAGPQGLQAKPGGDTRPRANHRPRVDDGRDPAEVQKFPRPSLTSTDKYRFIGIHSALVPGHQRAHPLKQLPPLSYSIRLTQRQHRQQCRRSASR